MSNKSQDLHPKFIELMELLSTMTDDEKINNPECGLLMADAMHYAPPHFKKMMDEKLTELGLMPKTSSYLDDGTPMLAMKDVCSIYGISESEALAFAKSAEQRRGEKYIFEACDSNRIN